jgi:hypothetical protein
VLPIILRIVMLSPSGCCYEVVNKANDRAVYEHNRRGLEDFSSLLLQRANSAGGRSRAAGKAPLRRFVSPSLPVV